MNRLATTTNFNTQPEYGVDNFDKEEPMELGKVCRVEDDKCYNCQERGHHARDSKKTRRDIFTGPQSSVKERKNFSTGRKGREVSICSFCDAPGHHHSVCRKKKRYLEDKKMKRAIKKMDDDDLEFGDFSDNDKDSDEEEDAINFMNDYFREPMDCTGERASILREL